jgi:ATP-dependent DNA helicase RecG
MAVRKVELAGGSMAVIEVQPSDAPPVRLDGRVLIRIGPRRGVATGQDERILSEKRRFRDKPFDAHPVPSAAISDLDQRYFEMEYVPRAIAPDLLEMNNRTYPERLSALKMIDSPENGLPTVAGLLVLSPRVLDFLPGAYVQFVRFAGQDTNSAILDEARIDGPVGQVLARLEDKLKANLKQEVAIGTDLHEERRPDYPLLALQQIVRNALLHRTYEHTNAPVRVYWFADHIEIASPGGPFGAVTTENFGAPHATDYRNPTLAEAMRVLGFVQRFGFGIPAARAELTKNGNPQPEFAVTPEFVTVIVRGRS